MSLTVKQRLDLYLPIYKNDPDQSGYIQLATEKTSACFFGSQKNEAIALRAAHIMSLVKTRPAGEAGPISMKREGELAISFDNASDINDDDLNQTSFGRQLKALTTASGPVMGVTGGNLGVIC